MSTWSKDDQSTKSWGTSYVSPTVTWGTLSTTSSSSSSFQTVIDHNTVWSPPNNSVVCSPQGWAPNIPSPQTPLYPSLGSAASYGGIYFYLFFRKPTDRSHRFLIIPLGYPSPPVSNSAATSACSWTQLQLNPLLDSRSTQCLNFDISALPYMPTSMNEPALYPPVTRIQLFIDVPPFKWPVNIQVHGSVTVALVLRHLFEFLQGYQNAHDLQKSKVQIPSSSGYYNNHPPSLSHQNHPNGFHSGKRRIDYLGRQRIFRGLSPEPNGAWVVHLLDR